MFPLPSPNRFPLLRLEQASAILSRRGVLVTAGPCASMASSRVSLKCRKGLPHALPEAPPAGGNRLPCNLFWRARNAPFPSPSYALFRVFYLTGGNLLDYGVSLPNWYIKSARNSKDNHLPVCVRKVAGAKFTFAGIFCGCFGSIFPRKVRPGGSDRFRSLSGRYSWMPRHEHWFGQRGLARR